MKKTTSTASGRLLQILLHLVFLLYLLLMLKIILLKYISIGQVVNNILTGDIDGFRSYNLIPFFTIKEFSRLTFHGEFLRGFANIMGNLLLFAPLGYFLPLLFRRFRKPRRVFLAAVTLSALLEVLQYVLCLGSADIDDVLLNTAGAMVGCGVFYGIFHLAHRKQKTIQKITLALSVLCFFAGALIAIPHFGLFLGIPGSFFPQTDTGNKPAAVNFTGDVAFLEKSGNDGTDKKAGETDESESETAKNDPAGNDRPAAGTESLCGYITSFTEEGFVINKVTTQELDNGASIAYSGEGAHQELIPVRVDPKAVYRRKKIYDMYGNRIEWEDITKTQLAAEDLVELKGHEENGVFTASEILVNTFTFMN